MVNGGDVQDVYIYQEKKKRMKNIYLSNHDDYLEKTRLYMPLVCHFRLSVWDNFSVI